MSVRARPVQPISSIFMPVWRDVTVEENLYQENWVMKSSACESCFLPKSRRRSVPLTVIVTLPLLTFFLRHFHNVEGDRRLLLMVLLFTFAVDTVAAASSDGDRESWIGRSSEDDAGRLRR